MLFVAPHAQFFVGDQLRAVGARVGKASVLIPTPYFSSLVLRLPFASHRFASLRRAEESSREIPSEALMRPRYLDLPGGFTRGTTDTLAARSAFAEVSRRGGPFDLFHAHFLGLNGFIGAALKEKFGKPLVLTAYGGDAYSVPFRDPYRRRVAEMVVRAADRLIAVSGPLAQNLAALGADPDRISVIPTGFDGSVFTPVPKEKAKALLGLPAGGRILLAVANLVPQKGHQFLLESFGALPKTCGDCTLVLVGGGVLEGKLRAMASALGVGNRVVFAGPRSHGEIPTWMSASDALVLPSLSEGSPTVIPEAMACGRPVVATRVGGVPDVVRDGEDGILVAPEDAPALAAAIERVLDGRWDSEAIRTHALSYSWGALAARIADVYAEVSPA